jgi:hypothetical protein
MYQLPSDRTSPLLAQLAALQTLRPAASQGGFQAELASLRNEVAHYAGYPGPAKASAPAGLTRRHHLQSAAFA